MFNVFCKWLIPKLADKCETNGNFIHITGKQGDDDVYLIRYFVFRSKYLSCYIHRFLRSDIDDPHDHPFNFLSYVVQGEYEEIRYHEIPSISGGSFLKAYKHSRLTGRWAYRPAKTIHKVLVDKTRTLDQKTDAPLTFIFRGRLIRNWFFYPYCKKTSFEKSQKVIWYKYLGVKPETRE